MMKKTILTLLASLALAAGASAQMLNISEIYGGGGNVGAPYTNDFIELYNYGPTSFSLSGYSVFYASSTGAFSASTVTPLTGSIAPGQSYLIAEGSGGAVGAALPTASATGGINLSATNGKVALALSTTTLTTIAPGATGVLDFVGYGSANAFTGTAAAPAGSNTTSVNKADPTTADTNNAAPAFLAAAPTPVPEPSSYFAVALGGLGAFAMLRFRRRRS